MLEPGAAAGAPQLDVHPDRGAALRSHPQQLHQLRRLLRHGHQVRNTEFLTIYYLLNMQISYLMEGRTKCNAGEKSCSKIFFVKCQSTAFYSIANCNLFDPRELKRSSKKIFKIERKLGQQFLQGFTYKYKFSFLRSQGPYPIQ